MFIILLSCFLLPLFPIPRSLTEECGALEESPGSLPNTASRSNGAVGDGGSLWSMGGPGTGPGPGACLGPGGLGPGGLGAQVGSQDSLRRCSQRKKSDVLLLGCASLLASVALGQDLLQLGRIQVGRDGRIEGWMDGRDERQNGEIK